MALVAPDAPFAPARLRELLEELLADLRESEATLAADPGDEAKRSRLRTVRELRADAVELAERVAAGRPDPELLRSTVNLLYDVSLVVAEYYKTYVRGQSVPRRPTNTPSSA